MSNDRATPRPWKIKPISYSRGIDKYFEIVAEERPNPICQTIVREIKSEREYYERDEANTQLIVTAVNEREALRNRVRLLEWKLYECAVELSYVQEAETLEMCSSGKGKVLVDEAMCILPVKDLSLETEEELHAALEGK